MQELMLFNKPPKPKLRYYQQRAVDSVCVDSFKNGIIVCPTGCGKSVILSEICYNYPLENILVLQPSKEILEQNFNKCSLYIDSSELSIYSASFNSKKIHRIVFATIGSIKEYDLFKKFSIIIIDECHLCTTDGLYGSLISYIEPKKLIGLTATPYRMSTKYGIEYKMLTRTKPKIFDTISYVYQNKTALAEGYWCKLNYWLEKYNRNGMTIKRGDYVESEIESRNKELNIYAKIGKTIYNTDSKRILVFLTTVKETYILNELLKLGDISSANISSYNTKKERDGIFKDFKSGKIRVLINVGICTTGFDFPELDCIILARPTFSLGLYVQMLGRGTRPHPNKEYCDIYDLCGNVKHFGKIEDFELVGDPSCFGLKNKDIFLIKPPPSYFKQYTNKENGENIVSFGKYIGKDIKDIPIDYIRYCIANYEQFADKQMFTNYLLDIEKNNHLQKIK